MSRETFAITIKINKLEALPSEYLELIKLWFKQYKVDVYNYFFEDDGHGICHLHGLVDIPMGFYRKRLHTPGVHFMITKLFNKQGWLEYCSKQSKTLYS